MNVAKPGAPVADFSLPDVLRPGQPGLAVDRSTGMIDDATWLIDGKKAGTGGSLAITFDEPGEYIVRRQTIGVGGTSFAEKKLTISPHEAPIAGLPLDQVHHMSVTH